MSDAKDEKAVNPHTGQPIPDDPKPAAAPAPMHPGQDFSEGAPASGAVPSAEAAAPSQQEIAIRAALETVMDPEINLSVIDLGLIREIQLLPEKTHVRMMLTTPFCPYAPQLMEEVKQATMGVVPKPCDVEIMPDAWSPDLMPDPGLLGYSF